MLCLIVYFLIKTINKIKREKLFVLLYKVFIQFYKKKKILQKLTNLLIRQIKNIKNYKYQPFYYKYTP